MSIEEIRARLDAATPGPWKTVRDDLTLYVEAESGELNPINLGYVGNRPENNAEFIAHAPEDMRRLLNAVEAVEAQHRIEYRDKWGRPSESDTGDGGWCYRCGRFAGAGCDTFKAITSALEPDS